MKAAAQILAIIAIGGEALIFGSPPAHALKCGCTMQISFAENTPEFRFLIDEMASTMPKPTDKDSVVDSGAKK
jgi:hypothetical protein